MRASLVGLVVLFVLVVAGSPGWSGDDGGSPAPLPPGVHEQGRWTFELHVDGKGSRSQRDRGVLLYDGLVLPGRPGVYATPWGAFVWQEEGLPWEDCGWLQSLSSAPHPVFPVLPDPSTFVRTVVRATTVAPHEAGDTSSRPPEWVAASMRDLGFETCRLEGPFRPLGPSPTALVADGGDRRIRAVLEALGDAAAVVRVRLEGTAGEVVTLRRRDGEQALVVRAVDGGSGAEQVFVAVAVRCSFGPSPTATPAPATPDPPEVTPAPEGSDAAAPAVDLANLEPVHSFRYEPDALVLEVTNPLLPVREAFKVVVTREEASRTVGVALVRVRESPPNEAKSIPWPVEVRIPLRDLGLERPAPIHLMNPLLP